MIPEIFPYGGRGAGMVEPAHTRYRSGQDNQLGIIDNSGEVIPIEGITECPTEERERRRQGPGERDGRDDDDRRRRGDYGSRYRDRWEEYRERVEQIQKLIDAIRNGIGDVPFNIRNDVFLDSNKIAEQMNRRQFGNFGAIK